MTRAVRGRTLDARTAAEAHRARGHAGGFTRVAGRVLGGVVRGVPRPLGGPGGTARAAPRTACALVQTARGPLGVPREVRGTSREPLGTSRGLPGALRGPLDTPRGLLLSPRTLIDRRRGLVAATGITASPPRARPQAPRAAIVGARTSRRVAGGPVAAVRGLVLAVRALALALRALAVALGETSLPVETCRRIASDVGRRRDYLSAGRRELRAAPVDVPRCHMKGARGLVHLRRGERIHLRLRRPSDAALPPNPRRAEANGPPAGRSGTPTVDSLRGGRASRRPRAHSVPAGGPSRRPRADSNRAGVPSRRPSADSVPAGGRSRASQGESPRRRRESLRRELESRSRWSATAARDGERL
jgi:hypothetical protein